MSMIYVVVDPQTWEFGPRHVFDDVTVAIDTSEGHDLVIELDPTQPASTRAVRIYHEGKWKPYAY